MERSNYYLRQIDLWGEQTQEKLTGKSLAIIGCGGLGSSLALALAGSGIGTIHLVDFDTIAEHNIHRQIAFATADVGRPKATVLAEAVQSRNPFTSVVPFNVDFEAYAQLRYDCDVILDATDNFMVRKQIDRQARAENIPWIYGSVEAFNGQVCFFDRAAFRIPGEGEHVPAGVTAPMVMHVASLQATLALRYLAGLPVERDHLSYLYFNDIGALVTQKFSIPVD